jgi:hypothetical protein
MASYVRRQVTLHFQLTFSTASTTGKAKKTKAGEKRKAPPPTPTLLSPDKREPGWKLWMVYGVMGLNEALLVPTAVSRVPASRANIRAQARAQVVGTRASPHTDLVLSSQIQTFETLTLYMLLYMLYL